MLDLEVTCVGAWIDESWWSYVQLLLHDLVVPFK